MALDSASGRLLWQRQYGEPRLAGGQFGTPVNRGAALLGNKVYVGTLDAHLLAYEAATGKPVWDVATTDNPDKYYISSAPLAVRDMIIIGVGNKEGGIG